MTSATGRHGLDDTDKFRVLFVCTGNICRSPFAEILTRHLLADRLGEGASEAFDVSSAGVQAVIGSQMHPDSREQLRPWGLDGAIAGRFAARQLVSTMVQQSDLVLGATPWHRSAIIEQAPRALATVFSLREFARLIDLVDQTALPTAPVARARVLVVEARRCRSLSPPRSPDVDDVPDPMGYPPQAHRDAALLIQVAVQAIIDVITSPRPLRSSS